MPSDTMLSQTSTVKMTYNSTAVNAVIMIAIGIDHTIVQKRLLVIGSNINRPKYNTGTVNMNAPNDRLAYLRDLEPGLKNDGFELSIVVYPHFFYHQVTS
jgi:hypothetical protein